jgi:hypothetical protein
MNFGMQKLKLTSVQWDMELQPRSELRNDWVEEYATDVANGATFPAIVVFFDGTSYWLADGFHRLLAHRCAGFDTIKADVRKGTRRDALLHSVSANADHGHRRTNEDKRRAIDILLHDPEWSRWSDNEIARQVGVDHKTVAKRREAILGNSQVVRLVTRGGTNYEMGTAKIGCEIPMSPPADEADEDPADEADEEDLRDRAMDAIREMADLPPPETVIDALMKSDSLDEPVQTLKKAQAWLKDFVPLYRSHWERVKKAVSGGG